MSRNMIFKGKAKRIDDIDLPEVGSKIGVGEDIVHTFIEVETRGTGFDKQGRVVILFEPHVFYRHLKGEKRARAVEQGLAYPKWGTKPYPKDSYSRLVRAMEIDETAALKACSWGMGQIMGENFHMVGYDSVQHMVQAFADDEETHLEAMIEFVKHNSIDDDLRRIEAKTKAGQKVTAADWIPIVRVYNGAGYAKNDYHNRAARAYNKWLKIRDTAWSKDMSIMQRAAEEDAAHAEGDQETGVEIEPIDNAHARNEAARAGAKPDGEEKPGEAAPDETAQKGEAVVGGRPTDPIVPVPSALDKFKDLTERADPYLKAGIGTSGKLASGGIVTTIAIGIWKALTSPFGLIGIGLGVGILIFWLWTRFATNREEMKNQAAQKERDHQMKMKLIELDIANAKNVATPSLYNAVVVPAVEK